MMFDVYKYIYLIGVGGIGMSALARYFNVQGKIVYGYDKVRSDLCIELETEGISVFYNDDISMIPEDVIHAQDRVLVIYTPAISEENFLFSFFRNHSFFLLKRAEVLGMISKDVFTIAIAGTHGKTTTSTMIAHVLKESGEDITAFLGGISRNYNTNFLLGKEGGILIVEADEYDRSFLHLFPDIAIITSVGIDHLDIYDDECDLHIAFKQFVSQIKSKGALFIESSIDINFTPPEGCVKLTYSASSEADFFAKNIRIKDGKMIFDVSCSNYIKQINDNKIKKDLVLHMPGMHNVSNSIASAGVCFYLGLSLTDIVNGLDTFQGINRRFDQHINTEKLVYIDDYAHHPDEVSATIDTTKKLYPSRELIVVFQPHLFSRTKILAHEFALSLQQADDLVLLDVYPAREKPIHGISSNMLLKLCNNPKKEVCSKEDLLSVLSNKNIDVLLTLGAGDIGTLVQPIKHMLN